MSDNSELYDCYKLKITPKKLKKQPHAGRHTVKFNSEEIDEAKNKIMSYDIAFAFRNSIKNLPKYKGFSNYLKVVRC